MEPINKWFHLKLLYNFLIFLLTLNPSEPRCNTSSPRWEGQSRLLVFWWTQWCIFPGNSLFARRVTSEGKSCSPTRVRAQHNVDTTGWKKSWMQCNTSWNQHNVRCMLKIWIMSQTGRGYGLILQQHNANFAYCEYKGRQISLEMCIDNALL